MNMKFNFIFIIRRSLSDQCVPCERRLLSWQIAKAAGHAAVCWALVLTAAIHGFAADAPNDPNPDSAASVATGSGLPTFLPHAADGRLWVSAQMNAIFQAHPEFPARYSGPNSLNNHYEKALSRVMTLYLGYRLNGSTELLVDVEGAGGRGLSNALGLAGFTNLDVVRNPSLGQAPYLARFEVHRVFALGKNMAEGQASPFSAFRSLPERRLEIRAGKMSLADLFDLNTEGTDSHFQFMNWAMDNNAAYDYAADTRGYTYAASLTYESKGWSLCFAEALMPTVANGIDMNWNLHQARSENYEWTLRRLLPRRPGGTLRILGFHNTANMGIYRVAVQRYLEGMDATPSITAHGLQSTAKYGFGLNVEQPVTGNVSVFGRFGWNNGKTESYVYTEADQSVSVGAAVYGRQWRRTRDKAGVAFVSDALSGDHSEYLALGGTGFILGDGRLNYGREKILEGYYTCHLWRGTYVGPDLQHINNPGYNRDRGPVIVPGFRVHLEF